MQIDWEIGLDDLGIGANAGTLRLNLLGNYLESFKIQALPDQPTVDYAGTIGDRQIDPFGISKPRWKATVTAQYSKGPFDLSVRWRYVGGMSDSSRATGGGTAPGVKSVNYTDLNVGWQIAKEYRFGLGVDNLFNRGIPVWQGYGATDTATYDMLGRRFYATVRANF
jgi:outer membrane receptor protein involved in Fe transport